MRPDQWLTAILAGLVVLAQPSAPAAMPHAVAPGKAHAKPMVRVAQADSATSNSTAPSNGGAPNSQPDSTAGSQQSPSNGAAPSNAAAPSNTAAPANSTAPANTTAPAGDGTGSQEGQDALDAVQSGQAVPLQQVVEAAQASTPGELIDARLIRRDGNLVYEIKILAADNTLHTVYYDARTGAPL